MHAGLVLTFLSIICRLSTMHIGTILSASPQILLPSSVAEKDTHTSSTVNIFEVMRV